VSRKDGVPMSGLVDPVLDLNEQRWDAVSCNVRFRITRAGGDFLGYVSIFLRYFSQSCAFAFRQRLLLMKRNTGDECEEGESTFATLMWTSLTLPLRTHRFLGGVMG
jgi:hypothetical protein